MIKHLFKRKYKAQTIKLFDGVIDWKGFDN